MYRQNGPVPPKALQIVDFKSKNRAVLNEAAVNQIIRSREIDRIPTVVISIGGVARSGKSFLLNLLVNYLQYLEKNASGEGWEMSDQSIQGVNWAQSRTAVTIGIWMWNTPYIITRSDGAKVAVLLMDSQGTGDNRRSDPKLDTLIMYISLQLSSIQLINIANYLTSNELTSLQLCTDYADIGTTAEESARRGQESDHLFETLIFVIRNFQGGNEFGEDPKLFREIREECINEELRRAVEGIEKSFHKITAFAFPYPGQTIATASEKQKAWTLQDIPEAFLQTTKTLCRLLFDSSRFPIHDLPTGEALLDRFGVLKFRIENTELPEIGTPADALQETILYRAYNKAQALYTGDLAEVEKNLLANETEMEVKERIHSIHMIALQVFHAEGHHEKYGRSPIWRKYEELFNSKYDNDQRTLVSKYTQQKQIAELEEHNREVKRQMEENAKENARQIGKLENESKQTKVKLDEATARSENREKKHREQLDKITEEMKTAREEDRAWYEREAERYQESIAQEKASRDRAEEIHGEKLSSLSSAIERMSQEHQEKERQTNNLIQQLQRDLERERNRPPPAPPGGGGSCTIL